jgi:hypothetical protein
MSSSCRKLYVALGAGALLGAGGGAAAANWDFVPRLEFGGTYNDNYRMANNSADKVMVYGPYIDASLDALLASPTSKLEFVPRVRSDDYPTDHADQSTDGYLDIDWDTRTQRSDFNGVATYSNQSVIYSELLPAAFPGVTLGQPASGVSGLVSFRNREQMEHVAPDFTYDFTQRTHLDLEAMYERATFQSASVVQGASLAQVGYDDYSGQAGLLFNVSPLSTLSVNAVGMRFAPQEGGHDTTTYGVNLEWNLTESQITHFYARIGDNRSRADVSTTTTVTTPPLRRGLPPSVTQVTTAGTVTSNGVTGGVGMELRYQITEVTLDFVRSLSPSDLGAEVIGDELRFRVLHAFRPRVSGFFAARGLRIRGSSGQGALAVSGEDYATAEAGLTYQFTQSFRVQANYTYIWQRYPGTPAATSNGVALAFIYQPLSRYEPLPQLTGIPQER